MHNQTARRLFKKCRYLSKKMNELKGTEVDKTILEVDIRPILNERIKRYSNLNVSEQFAMFMGKAQILELGLKNLLVRNFQYDQDKIERWTLGKIKIELSKRKIRGDFLSLLESFVECRNYIAHEMLANDALLVNIAGESGMLELRHLSKGITELEQLIIWFDLCEEHNAWT